MSSCGCSIRLPTAATLEFVHVAEYLGDATRLNYRMHNKLFVVDNEIGIVGGRNVGDEYFQGGRDFEFGDYDVIAAGPIVNQVSNSFDAFWNSPMAIPIEALAEGKPSAQDLDDYRGVLAAHHAQMIEADTLVHAHAGRRRAARGHARAASHRSCGRRRRSSTTARKRRRSRTASRAAGCCGIASAKWRSKFNRS